MRVARVLRRRFRSGGAVRGGSGKGNWAVTLLVAFCVLGTAALVISLSRMRNSLHIDKQRIRLFSLFMVVLTISLCIPAIVLLALNPVYVVGIVAIVTLCILVLPVLVWIPIGVNMSRHVSPRGIDNEATEISAADADGKASRDG